jgi:hypothetical protein
MCSVGNDTRGRGEETRDVLPERHLARAEHASEQRGGEVRAAAAERRHLAVGGGAQKPRYHGHGAAVQDGAQGRAGAALGTPQVGRGVAERAVGLDDVGGVHVRHGAPARLKGGRDDPRREALASRGEIVGGARRQLAQRREAARHLFELRERRVHVA